MKHRLLTAALILPIAMGTPALAQNSNANNPALASITTQLPRNVRPLRYDLAIDPAADQLTFKGVAQIDIEVLEATDTIILNGADLTVATASITPAGAEQEQGAKSVTADAAAQTITVKANTVLKPGKYSLVLDYAGKINQQATGLFALDYDTAAGKKRALFTQFEAPDARRMFPSWDEPIHRTPYDLKVRVPAGQMAVSNMPAVKTDKATGGNGNWITFQQTPAMSSYLLFLGVGEFDRITAKSGPTELGIVMKKGDGAKGKLALDSAVALLPYYNDYFGTPYPLPKLDNIAGPGSSQFFSAMENWGAIFSFESILLDDPAITTESTRQAIFGVNAHEMAHQWFGDLVTMAWWDDLWLNEGFASWMATKATNAIHPEWEPLLSRVGGRESAISQDSVVTTHPVVQKLQTVEQISQAFDSITYQKGQAVITMLEDYVGEAAWRNGVRAYIARHRYGNTVSDNLWNAIEKAAGKPITAIAHDFTLQPGVPLIRVEGAQCSGGSTRISLAQGEFSRDRKDAKALAWRVPVISATLGGAGDGRTIVEGGKGNVTAPGCGTLIVNKGQAGYYRTLYTAPMLDALVKDYARLQPIDQIGLLADQWNLGLAGYQSSARALDLLDAAPADANSALVGRMQTILASAYDMHEGDAAHQAMIARYASARLGPRLKALGWTAQPGERSNDAVLRNQLIGTLGYMGDKEAVAEANRRFASSDPAAMPGALRSTILGIVAANADATTWAKIETQARAEKNPLVKAQLYRLLGAARDKALAQKALALALTEEPGATTSAGLIGAVANEHPDLAYDFALANREKVEKLVDASSLSRYFPRLGGGSSDPAMVGKLEDYARRHLTPQSRKAADGAIASIKDRIRVRREALPAISRWFETKSR